ncbi:hypothetical protein ACHWQZ_G005943 [Mnemiopsis leidyi]
MTFISRERPSKLAVAAATTDLKVKDNFLADSDKPSSRSLVNQLQKELEDLKASTARGNQRVRNFKRKIELAEQKTDRLQNEHDRLVMKVASLTTEVKILRSQEADNEWLVATNNNLRAIVEELNQAKT